MKNSCSALEPGIYSEKELVKLICTDEQREIYFDANRFPDHWSKTQFIDLLKRMCLFEAGNKRKPYVVLEVLDVPISKAEVKLSRGVYKYIAEGILEELLLSDEGIIIATLWDIASDVGLINKNYILLKTQAPLIAEKMECDVDAIEDYCLRVDAPIKRYILNSIKYLALTMAVSYKPNMIISSWEDKNTINDDGTISIQRVHDRHIASSYEESLVANVIRDTESYCGIMRNQEKGFGSKARRYGIELHKRLADYNITSCQNGFSIACQDRNVARTIHTRLKANMQNVEKSSLYKEFSNHLVTFARKRYTNPGELDIFERLIELSLDPEARIIILPDNNKKSYRRRSKLTTTAHFEEVYRGYKRGV